MGGDGMGGLAVAIIAAMIAIMLVGLLVALLLARFIARSMQLGRLGTLAVSLGLGFVGLALAQLVVIATFYENVWSPPPRMRFNLPQGFAHQRVILLEDAAAPNSITWRGTEMPFQGLSTQVDLPASGVLRVRSLQHLAGRGDVTVTWSDGLATRGIGGGPAPPAVNATLYVTFLRGEPTADMPEDPPVHDQDAMAAYIRTREAAR